MEGDLQAVHSAKRAGPASRGAGR